jgi:hypothetical protein
MKIRDHSVMWAALHRQWFIGGDLHSIRLFPKGCCFSLSALSAESEKKNLLCVLGVSAVKIAFLNCNRSRLHIYDRISMGCETAVLNWPTATTIQVSRKGAAAPTGLNLVTSPNRGPLRRVAQPQRWARSMGLHSMSKVWPCREDGRRYELTDGMLLTRHEGSVRNP